MRVEVCHGRKEAPMASSDLHLPEVGLLPTRRLDAGERCDCCCAEPVVHVVVRSGLDLAFCGHHAREYELQLRRSGALIFVDRCAASLFW